MLRVSPHTVTVTFAASGETREYARDNAPLRRVRFQAGDTLRTRDDETFAVDAAAERAGLVYYRSGSRVIPETDLADSVTASQPAERLRAGQFDPPDEFDLRRRALEHQHRRRQSAVRGFAGGRIELIPHQLYIASEVTRRLNPRVLLADEVGLGKTIEACLILHRLLLTGRARRALVLVPESLVHQWFVELLRRFNLWFHIFDEERCQAIESAQPEANPFLDDQLVLAGLPLLAGNSRRLEQAATAGWDLLIVDEAHHLGWSPAAASPEYQAVETLARAADGLLLLTATPEQLGVASHFARLRLLDPDRFPSLEEFVHEADGYREVASLAEKLLAGTMLAPEDVRRLAAVLGRSETALSAGLQTAPDGPAARAPAAASLRANCIEALLDQHGTGRVMFRNTRATVSGFPRRVSRLHPLPAPAHPAEATALFDALAAEFAADARPTAGLEFKPEFARDPRIHWLADLLRAPEPAKVLLICRTRAKVEAIEAALRRRLAVKLAAFHEGLTLVKRDRNAAWFAEDDGARILVCSEIGSEGRNFQFAHHLVLFDLPLDPELLEQRLGRLDRIGQRHEIQVHVPYVSSSSQEVLAQWYEHGLDSFAKNLHGGRALMERFGPRVFDLAQDWHETAAGAHTDLTRLLRETAEARRELTTLLEQGRDRLLELNSHRPEAARTLVDAIRAIDEDRSLDDFMLAVFDQYHIQVEELNRRTFQLGSAGVFADAFPGLPPGGLTVTSDRTRALAREDVQFLTWDHPLVTGALDLLLGGATGNCSLARWIDPHTPGLYLETVHVLECIAPPALHVDRFLPPTPVRVLVDHRGIEVAPPVAAALPAALLRPAEAHGLFAHPELREELLPRLLAQATALAAARIPALVAAARHAMNDQLAHEITRLRELQAVNRSVRPEEIAKLTDHQRALDQHLTQARLRLDALRVIQRGPG